MSFHSILFESDGQGSHAGIEAPSHFEDLNLDQIVAAVTAEFEDYDLKPFYYEPLCDLGTIRYRQEIMCDLDNSLVMRSVKGFSEKMRSMRVCLKQSKGFHYYKHAMARRFLAAVDMYCQAVESIERDLRVSAVTSRGLRRFGEYVAEYVASTPFQDLVAESAKLKADLSAIRYSLLVDEGSMTVRHYNGESDYSAAVEETFEKFRRDVAGNHWVEVPKWSGINHIEAQIQDRVALLYPDVLLSLEVFCANHADYLDKKIEEFDRQVQFYVAYLTYIGMLRGTGLTFCQPALSQTSKEILGRNTFDLALANKLVSKKRTVVRNDLFLSGPERILVVSGPNQGGKTTLARTFGQLHYLATLGCPVPGDEARLFLFDRLFTHFERSEDPTNLRGKLQDDLIRMRQILDEATPNSIIVMNEIFSSTTVKDAIYLGKKIIGEMCALDLIGVCVTFLDELATLNEKTVSMVSVVDPSNPAIRTYKVERKPADGLAYALAIAEKYRVTYGQIMERVKA
jgi:DNA mismatch repair protein MutS